MAEIDLWHAVVQELAAHRPVVLAAVVHSQGSSPGKSGALLAIGQHGPLAGTVGGGQAEYLTIQQAQPLLTTGHTAVQRLHQIHRSHTPSTSGMVCGGSQTTILALLEPNQMADIQHLIDQLHDQQPFAWQLSPQGWAPAPPHAQPGWVDTDAAHWVYTHHCGTEGEVWLVGGGHVSLALSALLVGVNFRVVVCEERQGITTLAANHHAHAQLNLPYEALAHTIPDGTLVFVGIMTHAWERDAAALTALEGKMLGYLGLLGSTAKIARILGRKPRPAFFHAPMGLPIGSHTPAEIAISIAAEMISQRHQLRHCLA